MAFRRPPRPLGSGIEWHRTLRCMAEGGEPTVHITYHPGDPRTCEVAVRPETDIVITLHGTAGYEWAPISGATGLLAMVSGDTRDRVTRATVRAVAEGKAELRSTTSFQGDRFGPQTQLWRLRVTIHA